MYTYAAMNSVDVIVDIMDYLYKYYSEKYDEDTIEYKYLLRCIQLFRWFSEMAILNNSEYEIHFGTKKIKIDYENKSLCDFYDMTILNNLQLTDNYVLEPIDRTLPSNIVFINNKKNIQPKLKLHFKLYNIGSKTSISIIDNNNNVTETNYNEGSYELDLELENKINIKYEPTDINQTFAIASADISNMPTKNFALRYAGKVGEVNKVLAELCERLLIDVNPNISEDDAEKIKDISPAAEAIYQMIRYYELHHKDKVKGKRLTIKK